MNRRVRQQMILCAFLLCISNRFLYCIGQRGEGALRR